MEDVERSRHAVLPARRPRDGDHQGSCRRLPGPRSGSTADAPDAYSGVSLDTAPEGVDPAVIVEGAKAVGLALQLDPILAGVVARELAEKPDPAAVKAMVDMTPHDYAKLIEIVDRALAFK